MLEVRNLDAFYGAMQVLHGINLVVGAGEIVGLVGANAAGKSSLMFSLAGLRTSCRGEVLLDGAAIQQLTPWERPSKGLVLVPERRRLFPFMTVLENLEVGAYAPAARAALSRSLDEVFALLPTLSERRSQIAGSMSGGEQQMLAIGRALMARPQVLLLDEPTEGLAPIYVKLLFDLIADLRGKGRRYGQHRGSLARWLMRRRGAIGQRVLRRASVRAAVLFPVVPAGHDLPTQWPVRPKGRRDAWNERVAPDDGGISQDERDVAHFRITAMRTDFLV